MIAKLYFVIIFSTSFVKYFVLKSQRNRLFQIIKYWHDKNCIILRKISLRSDANITWSYRGNLCARGNWISVRLSLMSRQYRAFGMLNQCRCNVIPWKIKEFCSTGTWNCTHALQWINWKTIIKNVAFNAAQSTKQSYISQNRTLKLESKSLYTVLCIEYS